MEKITFTESKKKLYQHLHSDIRAVRIWRIDNPRFILESWITSDGFRIFQIWPDNSQTGKNKGFTEWGQIQ